MAIAVTEKGPSFPGWDGALGTTLPRRLCLCSCGRHSTNDEAEKCADRTPGYFTMAVASLCTSGWDSQAALRTRMRMVEQSRPTSVPSSSCDRRRPLSPGRTRASSSRCPKWCASYMKETEAQSAVSRNHTPGEMWTRLSWREPPSSRSVHRFRWRRCWLRADEWTCLRSPVTGTHAPLALEP